MSADTDSQVGGNHYRMYPGEMHWDRVHRLKLNWFQSNITKYVERCYLKEDTLQDLYKAKQYLEKLITIEEIKIKETPVNTTEVPGKNYVNQDQYPSGPRAPYDARN